MAETGAIAKIIESWGNVVRFLCAAILLILGVIWGIHLIFHLLSNDISDSVANIEYSGTEGVRVVMKSKNDGEIILTTLPANSPKLISTGVHLDKDENVRIKASGKVNLALERLLESIQKSKPLKYNWIDPTGAPFYIGHDYRRDTSRRGLLVYSGNNIGQIIFYLRDEDKPLPDLKPRFDSGKEKQVFAYTEIEHGKKDYMIITNETGKKCELMMAINDIYLDNSNQSKIAYTGTADSYIKARKEDYAYEKDRFDTRIKNVDSVIYQRPNYFYDDNIGEYMLSFETGIKEEAEKGLFAKFKHKLSSN